MTDDTNNLSYWLNWRFLLCAIWILTIIVAAVIVILKYEDFFKKRIKRRNNRQENIDDSWRTSLKVIHPGWLLAYRLIALTLLFSILTADTIVHSGDIFYFYTQWTFSLLTIYFGFGSLLSIYGCCQYRKDVGGNRVDGAGADVEPERGTYMALTTVENTNPHVESRISKIVDNWSYVFQILFQVCGGAVMLTDSVYWFILYPFFTADDYKLEFLMISLHTVNAVFFIGDMLLNSLEFPVFRLAYFGLWTSIYIIFQWILHMFVPSMWWPYAFLELSSPFAPLWYLGVGLLHLPCYGIVFLIFRMKQVMVSRFIKTLRGE